MVGFQRADGSSQVMGWWHKGRQDARETAYNLESFGPVEIEQYDLDTARITGREKLNKFDPDDRPLDSIQDKSVKFSPVHE